MPFQDEGLGLEIEEGEEESLEAESSSLGTQSELNKKKGGIGAHGHFSSPNSQASSFFSLDPYCSNSIIREAKRERETP